jgi:hypothetical protein
MYKPIKYISLFFLAVTIFNSIKISSYNKNLNTPSLIAKSQLTKENKSAGEFISGKQIKQEIQTSSLLVDKYSATSNEYITLDILLANYANRKNHGKLEITIETPSAFQKKVIDYQDILSDNSYYKFDFDKIKTKEILKLQSFSITLKGEGIPGSSITAWMSSDTRHGRIELDGKLTEFSFIFNIESFSPDKGKFNYPI